MSFTLPPDALGVYSDVSCAVVFKKMTIPDCCYYQSGKIICEGPRVVSVGVKSQRIAVDLPITTKTGACLNVA